MNSEEHTWAIVKLNGFKVLAGETHPAVYCGMRCIQIDVPPVHQYGGFTTYVAYSSVYAIQPCSPDAVREAVKEHSLYADDGWLTVEAQIEEVAR